MILKNQLTHENNKKELEARQKRVTNYEDAFQKIKNATGVNDFQGAENRSASFSLLMVASHPSVIRDASLLFEKGT